MSVPQGAEDVKMTGETDLPGHAMTGVTNFEESTPGMAATSQPEYPLATAPNPHYLQRFTYQHNGRTQVFDAALVASLVPEDERKRRLQRLEALGAQARQASYNKRRGGPDGDANVPLFPAPKRHNVLSVSVDRSLNNGSSISMSTTPLGGSLVSPAVLPPQSIGTAVTPVTPTPLDSLDGSRRSSLLNSNGSTDGEVVDDMEVAERAGMILGEEPSLLSPTASPRPENAMMESPMEQDVVDAVANAVAISGAPTTPQLATEELIRVSRNVSTINDAFEQLPAALHRFQIFNLFRSCSRETLSALFSELQGALRCDILSLLPPELADTVVGYLDASALCAAAQVSRGWYRLIDGNATVWKDRLTADGLEPTSEDLSRAQREKWGYVGWTREGVVAQNWPTNVLGQPVNMYKAIYRRRVLIQRNWFDTSVTPVRHSIACPDREVITCLDLKDDYIIASTDGKKHINVFETESSNLYTQFTDHEGGVWALKRVGKDILVSGSVDHTVRVWSLSKRRCTQVLRGHIATVRCLDVVMPVEVANAATGRTTKVPEWPVIVTGSRDTSLRMWRLPNSTDPEWDDADPVMADHDPWFLRSLQGHQASVRAVNGAGDTVVSGSYDNTVRVWRISTGECMHVLAGHTANVYSVLVDAERNRCISASMDSKVNIWDLDSGTLLNTLEGHTALVGLMRLDHENLVTAAADRTLRVWDANTGDLKHKLLGHDSAITCVDHDERCVVSGSERHLKLWNTRTGQFVRNLLCNMDHIWQVSFSHRRCVAAVSFGRTSFLEVLDFDFDPSSSEQRIS